MAKSKSPFGGKRAMPFGEPDADDKSSAKKPTNGKKKTSRKPKNGK